MQLRRIAIGIELGYPYRHNFNVLAGIQRYAKECGNWRCEIDPYGQDFQRGGRSIHYDGVIARATRGLIEQAAKHHIPFVNVWSEALNEPVPSVLLDYRAAGEQAAEYLLRRGYNHLAFHGFSQHAGTQLAQTQFEMIANKAKCPVSSLIVSSECDESAQHWNTYVRRCEKWIASWQTPIAVFTTHDNICRFLAQACLKAGLRIPEDVALIGLGNEPLVCTHLEPALSSIEPDLENVGYQAGALLDRMMNGEPPPAAPTFVKNIGLITRRSTNHYIVNDPLVQQAMTFILDNTHKGICVRDVANHVRTIVRTLERHFRLDMGCTIGEEISRRRINHATRLLLESDIPIKRIAYACGYSSANYFSQAFLKAKKVSPGELRRGRSPEMSV